MNRGIPGVCVWGGGMEVRHANSSENRSGKTEILLRKRDLWVNWWKFVQLIDGKIELIGKAKR